MIRKLLFTLLLFPTFVSAQINADRVIIIGRNALYYEDYVLSIQYFNQAINARPWSAEGYFYRGVAKYYLEDFLGGEYDCSSALERNPFMVSAYQVRGLCRINLGKFVEAAEDYRTAVQYEPENQGFWQNLILSLVEGKEYDKAVTELDKFQERWPKFARGYALRAQVSLMKQDTLQAIALLDKSLELDAFDGDAWSFRAVLSLQQEQYADAETQLNKAIHLQAKGAGNYINRALARYHQDNVIGAMNDYALEAYIGSNNYLGQFNRRLLPDQVGGDH